MSFKTFKIFGMILFIIIFFINALPGYAQTGGPYDLYLPIVMKNYPTYPIFGVEISQFSSSVLQRAEEANNYWVRHNGLLWSTLQPSQGEEINWDLVASLEANLIDASARGMEVILIVRSTPTWAQRYPGYYCGPVKQENFGDFANFMSAVVQRYSQPPYNVKYYEIGNEPDIAYSLMAGNPTSVYGCWGNVNIEYYDGGYYADMLKVVYPAIKSANPQAQVVLGGLLLDCDPRNVATGYCDSETKTLAPKFFEGILRNGGGNYLDVISFHGYPQYLVGINPIYSEQNFYSWRTAGGVVAGKLDFINSIMNQYGVNKPIFHTEGALILPTFSSLPSPEFEQAKADYVVWLYARNWSKGIKVTNWFTFNGPGYRQSGILDSTQTPRPAYYAFQFMANTLSKAEYVGPVSISESNIVGYEFSTTTKNYWILFSVDQSSTIEHLFALPAGVNAVYDSMGAIVDPDLSGNIDVTRPKYIEFLK